MVCHWVCHWFATGMPLVCHWQGVVINSYGYEEKDRGGGERERERERPITTAGAAATTATTATTAASRHELICRPALEITEERRAPGYRRRNLKFPTLFDAPTPPISMLREEACC